MAALPWITYLQRMVGRGHPTLADTLNTPLRTVLSQSGYDPDATNVMLPSFSKTVNAGSNAFTGTAEVRLTAAIALAGTLGWTVVYVPYKAWDGLAMLPYNASLVTFNAAVRMTCEDGDPTGWDVQAYGADPTGVADAGVAWNTARAQVPTNGGTVRVRVGAYKLTTAFTFAAQSNVLLLIDAGTTLTGAALPPESLVNTTINYSGTAAILGAPFKVNSPAPLVGEQLNLLRVGVFGAGGGIAQGIDSYMAYEGTNQTQVDLTLIGNHNLAATSRCIIEAVAGRGTLLVPAAPQIQDVLLQVGTDSFDSNGAQAVGTCGIFFMCGGTPGVGFVPGQIQFFCRDLAGVSRAYWTIQADGRIAPFLDNTYDIGIGGGGNVMRSVYAKQMHCEGDRGGFFINQTSAAAAQAATLTNAPTAGNPGFWLKIVLNGTNYSIPCWLG